MSRPQAETRETYRHFLPITTRWMDNDIYGHVNNVVYYSYFDTVVNEYLISKGALDIHAGDVIGLVVETHCNYFAPLAFPHRVEAGLRVAHLGSSSVRYEVGLFAQGEPLTAARGHFVHVYVDRTTRKPVPLPAPPPSGCGWGLRRSSSLMELPAAGGCGVPLPAVPPGSPPGGAGGAAMRLGTPQAIACVDEAITSRRSIRAYLPTPVPRETIEEILRVASRAPSGTNTQPWKVHVLTGEPLRGLVEKLRAAYDDPAEAQLHEPEYAYYPHEWVSPYIERRRKVGWDLYGLLGIVKGDKLRMHEQHGRNYAFFDAPVGLMFTIDRVMERGSWLDYGMFLQNVMVAARARGLDTCPQAAFTPFHRIIMDHLGAPPQEMLVCGMSLGQADPQAVENTLVTERAPVHEFTRFHG